MGPGAGLDRCRKSRPTGIRSPDLPARSESLYRLYYPGSSFTTMHLNYGFVIDHQMYKIYLSLSIINMATVRDFKAVSNRFLVKKIRINRILNTNL
jgi:hypothetical protein